MAALVLAAPLASAAEEKKVPLYAPGVGLIEIFKTDSPDDITRMEPVLRVPWMHDLACKPPATGENIWLVRNDFSDAFLVPEVAPGLGATPGTEYSFPYVAQITFYYDAGEAGNYTFSVWHGRNAFTLTIGDFLIANLSPDQPTGQAMCELTQGFHRAVLWLVSNIYPGDLRHDPYFEVMVLAPKATAPVIVQREAMSVEASDLPRPWRGK